MIQHAGQVTVGGIPRDAEPGDIFILPHPSANKCPTPHSENAPRLNGWALFAVLFVLANCIRLFLPLF